MGSNKGCSDWPHSQVEIKEGKNCHIQKALEVRRWWGDKICRWWIEEMANCLRTWVLREGMHRYICGQRRIWERAVWVPWGMKSWEYFKKVREERANTCDGEITALVYKRNCCVPSLLEQQLPLPLFNLVFPVLCIANLIYNSANIKLQG